MEPVWNLIVTDLKEKIRARPGKGKTTRGKVTVMEVPKVGGVTSQIHRNGIELERAIGDKGAKEVKFVPIEGDAVEKTREMSYVQGTLRGALRGLVSGPGYVATHTLYKAIEGAKAAYNAARELDATRWEAGKAALKGAALGVLKGFTHGVVDNIFMTVAQVGAVAVLGPTGVALTPLFGGIYNVVKDKVRGQEEAYIPLKLVLR